MNGQTVLDCIAAWASELVESGLPAQSGAGVDHQPAELMEV
jgi:hypothetical protein